MTFPFPDGFDPQPTLSGQGITLRPMADEDRDDLADAASDPLIWAGHPVPDRCKRATFDPYFDTLLGMGSALVILDDTGAMIGCTAFYTDPKAPSRLSIGFTFLVRDHWGGATNRIIKTLTMGHIFNTATEAWYHIAPTNIRSQKATMKLGAVFTHEGALDLGGGPQPWRCYCLTLEAWSA